MKVLLNQSNARAPMRSNPTDAGADLFATTNITIPCFQNYFMSFGIILEIPEGQAGFIYARSGLGSKSGIKPRNCVGVIDSKYRGEIGMMIQNDSEFDYTIKVGDRIAQIIFAPVFTPEFEVVDTLDFSEDRLGGFGHTGK